MTQAVPQPGPNMGASAERIDGRAKVTGKALYAADFPLSNPAYGYLVTSAIAKGRIAKFYLDVAKSIPGVIDIFTYQNIGPIKEVGFFQEDGQAATKFRPMSSPEIVHEGQIIALVVADTFESAREAAHRIGVIFDAEQPTASFDDRGIEIQAVSDIRKSHSDPAVGNAEAALSDAEVTLEARYGTPTQHHNPIELFSTTAVWSNDELTIYEPSQWVYGIRAGLAQQLKMPIEKVHVVSPYVGGAFGSKGSLYQRTAITALAARKIGRPVKLTVTRDQGFTVASYRAETRHRVRLGARRGGKLTAYAHEGWELTSRTDAYVVGGTENTAHMYGWDNAWTKVSVVRADRNTPGFMRSPPEMPYMYALEAAMDELAVKLGMDPVELRRINDTMVSPITKARYSSRSLMKCYDEAAQRFGWARRNPRPGSMRDGEWLVGWGCATATYPTQMSPAAARVRLFADGHATVQIAAHDVGTGAYTVTGQQAAETLGIPLENIEVQLGDTRLPPGPVAGGSITTASVCSVVKKACEAIRARLRLDAPQAQQEVARAGSGSAAGSGAGGGTAKGPAGYAAHSTSDNTRAVQLAFQNLGVGAVEEYAEWVPERSKPEDVQQLYNGRITITGGPGGDPVMFAFGAEFVEVRVHERTREIRVPRIVGAFASGKIMNPRTARSQYLGGLVWGISSALHEATEIDHRAARYVNDNLADYLVPVNADVADVEIILVPEVDNDVNPAGVKGIGELSNVGTAAAVANAVYHATGIRIRDLPIRVEKLLV